MVRIADLLVKSVAALLTLLALATWAGPLHPAADSLAVLRVPLVTLAVLAVIWTNWPRMLRWPLAGLGLIVLGHLVAMKLAAPDPGGVTVYQRNLWFGNDQMDSVAAEIRVLQPDVVTLQEVSEGNRVLLTQLRSDYPYQKFCGFRGWNGMAVLSKYPVVASDSFCTPRRGLAGARVRLPGGPVWVVSVHLGWPWPYEQRAQVDRIEGLVAGLDGTVVLSGDFNMVPWGSNVRRLARAARVRRAGPLRPTYRLKEAGWPLALPLPLDHVWAPGGGRSEVLPPIGSDHAGILAWVHIDED